MCNILVVDSKTEILETFSTIFSVLQIPAKCFSAKTSAETFLLLQAKKIKLLFLEIMLGSEDGRSICRQIKSSQSYKNVPVVLMSTSGTMLGNFKEHFADDMLEKPFDVDTVLEKINRYTNILVS